ncbi:uncharacterized protein LOC117181712 [Belonocnema kinseyi]|uniref:uncharacterized protein LOC117181712 n=1 Tax=Belonocnema kinseyi TaxID=2817044 RepID=UPI00143DE9F3|nr:uncharacterized protein LOC117181712 [Belonocnema kinseyi]
MFSVQVVTLILLYCFLDGISTQGITEIESKLEKLIGTLKRTANRYNNKSQNVDIIETWLQKPFNDLKKQCEDKNENELEKKLGYYNESLFNITSLVYKKNYTSTYYHPMVFNLWAKMLEFVSYGVENCLEQNGFHWNSNDKFYLMSKILYEIANRMSSVNHLTDEDYECTENMSPEIWACKQSMELESEESLFSALLGELKPSFGRCEENLEVKKCVLGAYKKCSKRFINVYKIMISPPGFALACKNLENL